MRTFIAIELPEEIRKTLAQLQDKLKATGADVKWVEPENIHLTLKFIGEVGEELKNKICTALAEVAGSNCAFKTKLSLIGAFPNIEYPRVIWVGITEGETDVKKIAHEIEDKLSKLGIAKEERAFTSHITIGRVRSPRGRKKLADAVNSQGQDFLKLGLEFPITKLTLFKSSLSPAGPVYELLSQQQIFGPIG